METMNKILLANGTAFLTSLPKNSVDLTFTQYPYQENYREMSLTWTEILRILNNNGKLCIIIEPRQDFLLHTLSELSKASHIDNENASYFNIDKIPIVCVQSSNDTIHENEMYFNTTRFILVATKMLKKSPIESNGQSQRAIIPNTWMINASPAIDDEKIRKNIYITKEWTEMHCPTIFINKISEHEKWFYCRKCVCAYPKSKLVFHKDHEIYCSNCATYGKNNDHISHQTYCTHEFYTRNLPIDLVNAIIDLMSKPNQLIFDPFCGDGTIPLCAHLNGRKYIGIEYYEPFMKIAQARIEFFATSRYTSKMPKTK